MKRLLTLLLVLALLLPLMGETTLAASDSIEGTWTSRLTDSTAALVIRADGTADLLVGVATYRCTWKLSGKTLTLTQNNSPVKGTYDGKTIQLTIGSTKLSFKRDDSFVAEDAAVEADPILFQDIPWGSNPDQARTGVAKAGLVKSKGNFYGTDDVVHSMLYTGNPQKPYELVQNYGNVLYEDYVYSNRIVKKIAGYEVDTIAMCYVYGVKNGKVNKNSKSLISVNVELKATDKDAALADLADKLTRVYGPCASENYYGKIWLGGDGTCLLLYKFFGPTLLYAKVDNLAMVEQLYEDLGFSVSSDDVDGL